MKREATNDDKQLKTILVVLGLLGASLWFSGCANQRPLQGGKAQFLTATALETNSFQIAQPENPASTASQNLETTTEEISVLPAGTVVTEKVSVIDAAGKTNVTIRSTTSPVPTTNTIRKTTKAAASVGPAQHDDSRKLAASLAALRPVQYVGIALLLAAVALAYFQWWTKAAICGATGIGMIVVAAIIPGNELLILGVGLVVVGIGCLLVLHAYHKGQLDQYLPDALDKNKI